MSEHGPSGSTGPAPEGDGPTEHGPQAVDARPDVPPAATAPTTPQPSFGQARQAPQPYGSYGQQPYGQQPYGQSPYSRPA